MVRNGILRAFCPVELPELRRNKPIVPSIPSSAELSAFLSEIENLKLEVTCEYRVTKKARVDYRVVFPLETTCGYGVPTT